MTLLGIDIGTASSKGVLVSDAGKILARASRPHQTSTPRPGWFEHDAETVWWADFLALTRELLSTWDGPVSFAEAAFAGHVDLTNAVFRDDLDLRVAGTLTGRTIGMRVSMRHEVALPPGWHVDTARDEETGLVRS